MTNSNTPQSEQQPDKASAESAKITAPIPTDPVQEAIKDYRAIKVALAGPKPVWCYKGC